MGVIAAQPFGTLTSWVGGRCEHTSSVDPIEFYEVGGCFEEVLGDRESGLLAGI